MPASAIRTRVVIIGAGFGGIGLGIKLKLAGLNDFLILEKSDCVGGVWRENRYPGAACDVPSHLYSFSFEPRADWPDKFGKQADILDYLTQCARICREHNVLLICDEIQTGMGRTGRFVACEHENVRPDGIILGKALGGGLLPVSALVGTDDLMQVFTPGDHGSTFGGNPLAAAVGLAALEVLFDEGLIARSAELGAHLLARLETVRSPLIREVRGKGLFIGVEVDRDRIAARDVVDRLLARGILSKDTHGTVVRFAPPLTIDRETLDWAVEEVRAVFVELGGGLRRAA